MTINRYDVEYDGWMEMEANGEYVRYADHVVEVDALRAECDAMRKEGAVHHHCHECGRTVHIRAVTCSECVEKKGRSDA